MVSSYNEAVYLSVQWIVNSNTIIIYLMIYIFMKYNYVQIWIKKLLKLKKKVNCFPFIRQPLLEIRLYELTDKNFIANWGSLNQLHWHTCFSRSYSPRNLRVWKAESASCVPQSPVCLLWSQVSFLLILRIFFHKFLSMNSPYLE